jgi:hypothetical protein
MAHSMGWLLALPDSYQTLASLFLWQLQKQRCKREVTKNCHLVCQDVRVEQNVAVVGDSVLVAVVFVDSRKI